MADRSNSLGDMLAHVWASEHVEDFEKFIGRIESSRKPSDYTQKTNEVLIISAGVLRLCRWEILIRISLEKLGLSWEQADDRANQVAGSFGPTTLAWLSFLHTDESLTRFFIGLNLELAEVSREMAARTREKSARRSVMHFSEDDSSSIKDLLAAVEKEAARWGNHKLFHPYRRADETKDRKQTTLLKIHEAYVKTGEEGFNEIKRNFAVPVLRITKLPLSQKKEKLLDQLRIATLEEDIAHMARSILPILNGEKLPKRAYQSVRGQDKKFKGKKRDGKEIGSNDAGESLDRYIIERRFGVWKKDEERQEALEEMGLRKPEEGNHPISLALCRATKKVIQNRRTKRMQEATRIFFQQLMNHGSVPDATKVAKLTRPTRKQILLELQRELERPKPPPAKK